MHLKLNKYKFLLGGATLLTCMFASPTIAKADNEASFFFEPKTSSVVINLEEGFSMDSISLNGKSVDYSVTVDKNDEVDSDKTFYLKNIPANSSNDIIVKLKNEKGEFVSVPYSFENNNFTALNTPYTFLEYEYDIEKDAFNFGLISPLSEPTNHPIQVFVGNKLVQANLTYGELGWGANLSITSGSIPFKDYKDKQEVRITYLKDGENVDIKKFTFDFSKRVSFTDSKGHWAGNVIDTYGKLGKIRGVAENLFLPDAKITRAQAATMIARFNDFNESDYTVSKTFSDTKGHWAEKNIAYLSEQGILGGYEDGSFKPDAYITRAETFALLSKYMFATNKIYPSSSPIKDFDGEFSSKYWFANSAYTLYNAEVIVGYEDNDGIKLMPQNDITRAEFLTMLSRTDSAQMFNFFYLIFTEHLK